jgi:integrase
MVRQGASLRSSVVPRSLQHLIDVYRSSPEFQQLAASTRADYEKGLRLLEAAFGKLPVGGIAPHFLTRIRDTFARGEPQKPKGAVGSASRLGRANATSLGTDEAPQRGSLTPRRANKVLTVLSILMSHAVSIGWRKDNPCLQQGKSLKLRVGEWLPWPDEALEQFWQRAPRELVVASFVGVFTGLRGQDQIRLRWPDYDGTTLVVTPSKTKDSTRVRLVLPVHPVLKGLLDALPRTAETILTGPSGKPWVESTFHSAVSAEIRAAGLSGLVWHGLRKTAAGRLAEAGCSDAEIQAITGHSTSKMVEKYRRGAFQKRLAEEAIRKLVASGFGASAPQIGKTP